MKKHALIPILILVYAPLSHAFGMKQLPVNFVGTWHIETESVYMDPINSISDKNGLEEPKLQKSTSTVNITHQDGHSFWGVRNSQNEGAQPFVAIVDSAESTIVAVDNYGSIRGKVLNKNTFTYCYTQVPNKQDRLAYVECAVARRQK